MFDFRPDEEQKMLLDAIRRLAEEKIRKQFREAEELGRIPADLVQAGWDIGWLPTAVPEALGGMGEYSAVTGALAMEGLAYGDLAIALEMMTPNLIALPLLLCGTEAQQSRFLPRFAGEKAPRATAALTERVYQFDPRNLNTTAVRDGDQYRLNGAKVYVPLAKTAELILVWADEDGQAQGFLIPTNAAGVTIGRRDKLMGIQALQTYEVILENVEVPLSDKLGEESGCDFDLILNHSRVGLAAAAVGMAQAACDYTREYTKQRVQFGKPVAQNQSLAFMMADMFSDVESMRMMVWEAAWLLDEGKEATQATTVMKYYVDSAIVRVADAAVQGLGGYGYIREYPVELYLRNARGFATFDGLGMV